MPAEPAPGQAAATAFTLTGSTGGTTGVASTFTVTPNGPLSGAATVNITASGATLSTSSLSFSSGATAGQTFTVTLATAGSTSVSITNTLGLTNTPSSISYTASDPVAGGTWQQLTVAPHSRKVISTVGNGAAPSFDTTYPASVDAMVPTLVQAIPDKSFCRATIGEPGVLYYAGSLHSNYPGSEIDRIDLTNLTSTAVTTSINHQPRVPPEGPSSGYGSGSGAYVYAQYGTPLADTNEWQPYAHHTWTKNGWHPTWGWFSQIHYAVADGAAVGANPAGNGSAYQQGSSTFGLVTYNFDEGKYKTRVTAPPGTSGASDWNQHRHSILFLETNNSSVVTVKELTGVGSSPATLFTFDSAALSGNTWGFANNTSGNGILVKWLESNRYLCLRIDGNKFSGDPASFGAYHTLFLINLVDSTQVRKLTVPTSPLSGTSVNADGNIAFCVDRNSRRVFWLVFQGLTIQSTAQFTRFYVSNFDTLLDWVEITTTSFPTITTASSNTYAASWLASKREPMHYYNGHLFVSLPEGGGPSSPGYTNGAINMWRCKVDDSAALPVFRFHRYDYQKQAFAFTNTSVATLQMIGTKHVNWAHNAATGKYVQHAGDFGMSTAQSMCELVFDGTSRGYKFTQILDENTSPPSGKFRPSSPDDGHWFYVPADSAWTAGRGKFVWMRGGDGEPMFYNAVLRAKYGASDSNGTAPQVAAAVADGWNIASKFYLFDPATATFDLLGGPTGWTQDNGSASWPSVWTAGSSTSRNGYFDPVTGCLWRFYNFGSMALAKFDFAAQTVKIFAISTWVSPETSRTIFLDGLNPAAISDVIADGSKPLFCWYDSDSSRYRTYGELNWEHKATWINPATGHLYVVSPGTGYLWRFDLRGTYSDFGDGWRLPFAPVGSRVPLNGTYPTVNSRTTWPPVLYNGDVKMNSLLFPFAGGLLYLSCSHHDGGVSGEPHYAYWRALGDTGAWSNVTMPGEFTANAGSAKIPYSIDNDEVLLISHAYTDIDTVQGNYRYFWRMVQTPTTAHRRISIQGQSNASGVPSISALSSLDSALYTMCLSPFARVYIWNPGAGAYQQLQYGVNAMGTGTSSFGPECGIAARWMRETASGNLYIDKQTADGQPISYFQNGGSFYTASQTARSAQNAWLVTNGITAHELGWLWVQGESDSAASQGTYQSALETLTTDRVAGGLQLPGVSRVLVQMRTGTSLYGAGVAAAKIAYADNNDRLNRVITMAPYFEGDNLHLSARGQLQLGYDAYQRMFSASNMEA